MGRRALHLASFIFLLPASCCPMPASVRPPRATIMAPRYPAQFLRHALVSFRLRRSGACRSRPSSATLERNAMRLPRRAELRRIDVMPGICPRCQEHAVLRSPPSDADMFVASAAHAAPVQHASAAPPYRDGARYAPFEARATTLAGRHTPPRRLSRSPPPQAIPLTPMLLFAKIPRRERHDADERSFTAQARLCANQFSAAPPRFHASRRVYRLTPSRATRRDTPARRTIAIITVIVR